MARSFKLSVGQALDTALAGKVITMTSPTTPSRKSEVKYDRSSKQWWERTLEPVTTYWFAVKNCPMAVHSLEDSADSIVWEEVDPSPRFQVQAEINDDFVLEVRVLDHGYIAVICNVNEAEELHTKIRDAINCSACNSSLDFYGSCAGCYQEQEDSKQKS